MHKIQESRKNENSAFGQRFWKMDIFKNVQKPKAQNILGKKLEKTRCDHYALIFVFLRKML
jgi:hypothetical protein